MMFRVFKFIVLTLSSSFFVTWYEKIEVSASAPVNVTTQHTFQEDYFTMLSDMLDKYIIAPPNASVPLDLKYPHMQDVSQFGQSRQILKILEYKQNGFYVECGAFDGEKYSNTLMLERSYNWTGLLIEPNPKNFTNMLGKHRKAYMSNTCLSVRPYPMTVLFQQNGSLGMISKEDLDANPIEKVVVQCFPLFMYLQALKRMTIDYFSLDVEGNELDVLRTIPWDWLNIRVLSIAYTHGEETKEDMRSYMGEKGYFLHSHIPWGLNRNSDFIFVKAT